MHLGFSLTVMLLGLMIVFLGLVILIACIKVMSTIIGSARKKQEAAEAAKAVSQPKPAPVVVPEPVAEAAAQETGEDKNELVAVITAALMAYSKATDGKTLVVRNIRRANAWASAGRAEQISRF